MEQRQAKALQIAATTALAPHNGRWKVPSQAGTGNKPVRTAADGSCHCGCPDFEERLSPGKHIMAVEITIQRETAKAPESRTRRPSRSRTRRTGLPTTAPSATRSG